jgi:hypothetical protein
VGDNNNGISNKHGHKHGHSVHVNIKGDATVGFINDNMVSNTEYNNRFLKDKVSDEFSGFIFEIQSIA